MLEVQRNVSDERLDESLLQPELLLCVIKGFIFYLRKKRKAIRTNTSTSTGVRQFVFFTLLILRSWLGATLYLG